MFDTIPDALQPNVTAFITYDASAELASGQNDETVDEYVTVEDESLVPLIVSASLLLSSMWLT